MDERLRLGPHVVSYHVALSDQTIFVDYQPIQTYRATGMGFVRTDADLCPFAKAKAIRKTCRGIMHDGGRINICQELPGRLWMAFALAKGQRSASVRTKPMPV